MSVVKPARALYISAGLLLLIGFLQGGALAEDNVYLLSFYTGSWFLGGTDANLVFRLKGTGGDSGLTWVRPEGSQLELGGVDTFPVTTDYGPITRVMISHDGAGQGPSWHFYKLVIRDLVRQQTLTYVCDCWVPDDVVTPSHVFTENLDECSSNPCLNAASCVDGLRSFRCECAPGWTGERCEVDVDECEHDGAAPWCENGGVCQNEAPGATCDCPPGYTGPRCEHDVDECLMASQNRCMNDAACVNTAPGFHCACLPGYSGVYCENDVDECVTSQPCHNNATCVNVYGGYVCECSEGWTGMSCSSDIDECSRELLNIAGNTPCVENSICMDTICMNNSTCVNTYGGYQCICHHGFTGLRCDNDINECLRNDTAWCENGATCENSLGGWQCVCPDGYHGNRCENDVDECESADELCLHGGLCNNTFGGYSCTCLPAYSGLRCENDVDQCVPQPCLNGGTCRDDVTSYSCSCAPGYHGHHCQNETNECASDPCAGGATCVDAVNQYMCVCPPGSMGENCQIGTTASPSGQEGSTVVENFNLVGPRNVEPFINELNNLTLEGNDSETERTTDGLLVIDTSSTTLEEGSRPNDTTAKTEEGDISTQGISSTTLGPSAEKDIVVNEAGLAKSALGLCLHVSVVLTISLIMN